LSALDVVRIKVQPLQLTVAPAPTLSVPPALPSIT